VTIQHRGSLLPVRLPSASAHHQKRKNQSLGVGFSPSTARWCGLLRKPAGSGGKPRASCYTQTGIPGHGDGWQGGAEQPPYRLDDHVPAKLRQFATSLIRLLECGFNGFQTVFAVKSLDTCEPLIQHARVLLQVISRGYVRFDFIHDGNHHLVLHLWREL